MNHQQPVSSTTWRRNQWVMTLAVFVVFTGFAFVIPFLPLYVRHLGVVGEEQVALWGGVLIGIAPLLAGLLAPVWGRWADRYGYKRVALRALGSYVVVLALSAWVGDVWQFLALRIATGLLGGIGPLGLAMATVASPREQTGRAVGALQAAQILAAAVGPFTGGFLADAIGIRATFLATAALCAVAFVCVAAWYHDVPAAGRGVVKAGGSFLAVFHVPRLPALLVTLFLVNFVGRSFTPILPLYLQSLGVSPARLAVSTGGLISSYAVAAALSAWFLGRATRSWSPVALLALSLLGGAASVLPMALISSFMSLLGLAVLLGLTSGGALTLCYTLGGWLVPKQIKATAYGFFSGAALLGGAISPAVAGLLVRWDLRGIYYLDTGLYIILIVAVLPALRVVARRPADAHPAVDQD